MKLLKRIQLRLFLEKQSQEDNLKKQEESIMRQEELRKATKMYEHEMKVKNYLILKFQPEIEIISSHKSHKSIITNKKKKNGEFWKLR